MIALWGSLAGMLLYLELVYHFGGFGWCSFHPVLTIFLILTWSGAETLLVGILKGKWKKLVYYSFLWIPLVWTGAQLVYLRIFKQPMLWQAIFKGGGDALTNYWREALDGVLRTLPVIVILILPAIILGIVLHCKQWVFPDFKGIQILRTAVIFVVGVTGFFVTIEIEKSLETTTYEDYNEFFDPLTVAEKMGVLPLLQRDTSWEIVALLKSLGGMEQSWQWLDSGRESGNQSSSDKELEEESGHVGATDGMQAVGQENTGEAGENQESGQENAGDNQESGQGNTGEVGENRKTGQGNADEAGGMQEESPVREQIFELDFDKLHALADNDHQTWLAEYIAQVEPTRTNEYTGIFEGYNLIYLTAEGFSTHAIREDLTPTLYRLTHSGFIFENYYVPLWQTSTSDGEYINCTGLIPDGQFSMRKSGENRLAYTLPRFFAKEGVASYAYHNNTLSYYDRYLTHPNLGYDFKGCKLGELSEEEWGGQIFPMEHPNQWPASDLEMLQGTIPEYVGNERFHVYYMTVSGHMNYNFRGNAMSSKNREAVADLELSENARAYLACNIELDKALEYLLAQLEAAGQLERTVICMSADHYPYSMSTEQYEELAGKPLTEGMDMYRNSLILWNAGMEQEPVHVTKACGSMDIVPTLLNLFGFEYDARMYAGRDIFSDEEGLVIFNDRSFVTDAVIYNRKEKETVWLTDSEGNFIIPTEEQEAYFADKKQEVKERYQFSAYILQENYYQDVEQAVISD